MTNIEWILETARRLGLDLPGCANEYQIVRTYAGHHQRSDGAWSWFIVHKAGNFDPRLGSQWPITQLRTFERRGEWKITLYTHELTLDSSFIPENIG